MSSLLRNTPFLVLALLAFATVDDSGVRSVTTIVRGQIDDFETDTTMGWRTGIPTDPFAPVRVEDGGPGGLGDAYLLARSSGGGGPGSKLVIYNDSQWTGNYKAAGVNIISMHVNNLDSVDLMLRLRVESDAGGAFLSRDSVFVPALSGWQVKQFPVTDSAFVGFGNVDIALQSVDRLRLFHGESRNWSPEPVKAQLGIDNIAAIGGGAGFDDRPLADRPQITAVYPNPAVDFLSIEFSVAPSEEIRLAVFDILGRRVARFGARSTSETLWVAELAPGHYWIRFDDGSALPGGFPTAFVVAR